MTANSKPQDLRRTLARAALIALGSIAGLVVALGLALETPWGVRAVAGLALGLANPWPGTRLEVGGAAGGFLTGIELRGLRLLSQRGVAIASLDTVRLAYRPAELLGPRRRIRELRVAGPAVDLAEWPAPPTPARPPASKPSTQDLTLDRFELQDGACELRALRFARDSLWSARDLLLRARDLRLRGPAVTFTLDTLGAALATAAGPPDRFRVAARGRLESDGLRDVRVAIDGDSTHLSAGGSFRLPGTEASSASTDFWLGLEPLAARDIRRFAPPGFDPGDVTLDVRLHGDGPKLLASVVARSRRGGELKLGARGSASPSGPVELWARGDATAIDVGAWTGRAPGTLVVQGTLDADLRGPDRRRLNGPLNIILDGSRAGGHGFDRARLAAHFAEGSASMKAEAASEGFVLRANGSAQPFGEPPACDLTATLWMPPVGLRSATPRRDGLAPAPGTLSADLSIRGRSLADAAAKLRAAFRPESERAPLFGAGSFVATLDQGVARWRGGLDVSGGRLSASGQITTGKDPEYWIREGEAIGIDFAALLGDTTESRLDARFGLEGRGLSPGAARASARGSLALQHGRHRIEADRADLELRDGRARLAAVARIDGAELEGRGSLGPLAGPLREADLLIAFRRLDLARVSGDTAIATDLAGRIEGSARGPDLAALAAALGAGRTPPRTRGSLRVVLGPSRWRDQDLSALDLSARLEGSDVTLAGRLESSFGRGRLSGTLLPFLAPPSVRIAPLTLEGLDLGRLLGVPGLATGIGGTVTVSAAGRDTGSLALEVTAFLDGSSLNQVRFSRLALRGRLANGRLDAAIDARSPADSLHARLEGRISDRGRGEPLQLAARGTARVGDLGAVIGRDSLDAGVDLDFEVEASREPGTPPSLASASGRVEGRARFGGARLDTVRSRFTLQRGVLELARLELRSSIADLAGAGRIALPGSPSRDTTDLRLTGTIHDPRPLAPWLGARSLEVETGRFSVAASGTPAATHVRGDFTAARIARNSTRADSLVLQVSGTVADTTLTALDARLELINLVPAGLPPRDLDARGQWDGRQLAVQARVVGDENRWQEIAFRFTPGPTRSELRLERFEAMRGESRLALERPTDITFGDRLHVDRLAILQNGVPRLRLDGGIEPDGRADLRASIDSLEVADYLDPFGITGLRGRLSGSAALTGTRSRPVADATWRAVLDPGKRPARLDGRLHWAEGELRGDAAFVQRAGQQLSLVVQLPLALTLAPPPGEGAVTLQERPLSWTLEARRFDLAWFGPLISPRVARDLRGSLDGRVEAGGDPGHPSYQGTLALDGARVQLPGLGTRYESERLGLAFSGRTLSFDKAVVTSGKGRIELNGHATFEGRRRPAFELRATAKKLPVMNTAGAILQVSGQLGATGRMPAPQVEGTLEVLNSALYLEGGESERKVEKVELSERDRRELEAKFGATTAPSGPRGPGLLDSLRADVVTRIGSGVWVRRRSDPVLALELAGEVRARKEPGRPWTATGRLDIQTGRSYLSFLGRRFDITSASIELPGPISGAGAEVEARYESESSQSISAPDVTAHLTVDTTGTNIDLRSEPYMDQASLINYLATGKTQGEMASGTATGLAVGSVLGAVGGAAGRSLGFQVVQVTQDAYGGQTLSAGNYVDPRIYLGFRQPVVQGKNTTTTGSQGETSTTEFEVEFEAAKRLLLNVQGGGTQYRFLLRPRLGK